MALFTSRPCANARHAPDSSRGFTLLEMLVVLAIIALATAVVVPAAATWLQAAEARSWREDLRVKLVELPTLAFSRGTPLEVDAEALRTQVPSLPTSLELRLSQPLRYSPTGAASGGWVEVARPGDRQPLARWQVEPLSGSVSP